MPVRPSHRPSLAQRVDDVDRAVDFAMDAVLVAATQHIQYLRWGAADGAPPWIHTVLQRFLVSLFGALDGAQRAGAMRKLLAAIAHSVNSPYVVAFLIEVRTGQVECARARSPCTLMPHAVPLDVTAGRWPTGGGQLVDGR